MSALDELKDNNNWGSHYQWLGNRSLHLEVVPDLDAEFLQLRKGWHWFCSCNYENNIPVCTHCGKTYSDNLKELRARIAELEEARDAGGRIIDNLEDAAEKTKQSITTLEAARDEARVQITDCRDLARTGLAPDSYNFSEEQWAQHRLNLIAGRLSAYLKNFGGLE
jgi:exonuclease VII small subunit